MLSVYKECPILRSPIVAGEQSLASQAQNENTTQRFVTAPIGRTVRHGQGSTLTLVR